MKMEKYGVKNPNKPNEAFSTKQLKAVAIKFLLLRCKSTGCLYVLKKLAS